MTSVAETGQWAVRGTGADEAASAKSVLGRILPRRLEIGDVEERRGNERIPTVIPIRLTIANATEAVEGRAVNISRRGVFIALDDPPPVGALVDIELQLANRRLLLHARAEVVRIVQDGALSGIGARFAVISYEAQELIDAMVWAETHPSED